MKTKENMLTIGILGILGFILILFIALFPYLGQLFYMFIHTGWIRVVVFTVIFIIVQLCLSRSRSNNIFYISCVLYFTFLIFIVGWDLQGNAMFNLPLKWITQPLGTLSVSTDMTVYGATVSWDASFKILQNNGNVINIPLFLILLYRVIQYIVWFIIIGYINKITFIKLLNRIGSK